MKKFTNYIKESVDESEIDNILNELRDEDIVCSHEIQYLVEHNHKMANGTSNVHNLNVSKELAEIKGEYDIRTTVSVGDTYETTYTLDMYPAQKDVNRVKSLFETLERLSYLGDNFVYRLKPGLGFECVYTTKIKSTPKIEPWNKLWKTITDLDNLKEFSGARLALGNHIERDKRFYSMDNIQAEDSEEVAVRFGKLIKPFFGPAKHARRGPNNGMYITYEFEGINVLIQYGKTPAHKDDPHKRYYFNFIFEGDETLLPQVLGFSERELLYIP